jgi:hypothetical protein
MERYKKQKEFFKSKDKEKWKLLKMYKNLFMGNERGNMAMYPNIVLPGGALTYSSTTTWTPLASEVCLIQQTDFSRVMKDPYVISWKFTQIMLNGVNDFYIGVGVRDSSDTPAIPP